MPVRFNFGVTISSFANLPSSVVLSYRIQAELAPIPPTVLEESQLTVGSPFLFTRFQPTGGKAVPSNPSKNGNVPAPMILTVKVLVIVDDPFALVTVSV